MKDNNLIFKNNFQEIEKKITSIKKSYEFSKLLSLLKNEIQNKEKTINVLNKNYQFNFKFSQLQKFKKFRKIKIIGMGGSILGAEAIHDIFKGKIKRMLIL